jgi:hypothetical protein
LRDRRRRSGLPAGVHARSIRQGSIRQGSITQGSIRQASIRQASIRQASIRQGSIRQASIRQASIRQASIRQASIRQGSHAERDGRVGCAPLLTFDGDAICAASDAATRAGATRPPRGRSRAAPRCGVSGRTRRPHRSRSRAPRQCPVERGSFSTKIGRKHPVSSRVFVV